MDRSGVEFGQRTAGPSLASERRQRLAAVAFFALYLGIGIAIHTDYGASWDEPLNRDLGTRTLQHIESRWNGSGIPWKETSRGLIAEQGPLFEVILALGERILGLEDSRAILQMRHLATFLAFWLGALAFYSLIRLRFADRGVALLGVSLLVLTPRLFAHSFYNSKDAVLAALFSIGTLTLFRLLRDRSLWSAGLHAVACAAAFGVRVVGLLLVAVTLALVLLQLWGRGTDVAERRRVLFATGAFLVLFTVLAALVSPPLWDDPLAGLVEGIRGLAAAKQVDNGFSLYLGEFVPVDRLPWHYVPLWMLITLPIPYLVFLVAGLWAIGQQLVRDSWSSVASTQSIGFVLLFFAPLLAAIVVRPVLYDDWRHLYFTQPALLAIALTGFVEIARRPRLRTAAWSAALATVLLGIGTLIRHHPYQNVYFNSLAGPDVEERFELDYWGLSFREGLEFVLRTDPGETIPISVSDYPGIVNSLLLEKAQRDRLRFVPLEEARFFLSNHRQPATYADFRARRYPYRNEAYAVEIGDATLLGVYELR